MPLKDRQTLKNLFKNGSMPSESSFGDIIDSSINKIDDGFSKSMDDGLMLSPIGDSNKILSVFKRITDKNPEWSLIHEDIDTEKGLSGSLKFVHKNSEELVLNLSSNGNVGIANDDPKYPLDVNGFIASKGRLGTAQQKTTVPANGKWQTIIDGLNHANAFEITARTGIYRTGRHTLVHAIAVSTFGNSYSRIKKTHARFSLWRSARIRFRWTGTTHNYALQIKTSKDLGTDVLIKYHITQLWSDDEMGEPAHFLNVVKI